MAGQTKNVRGFDRFLRGLIGVLAGVLANFWLAGALQWAVYGVGATLVFTALMGFCPLYSVLGIGKGAAHAGAGGSTSFVPVLAVLAIVAAGAASAYASQLFSREFFLEDFNAMNGFYKQTLFLTGKGERENAVANYDQLLVAYAGFQAKYTAWRPVALRGDGAFAGDLDAVKGMLQGVEGQVRNGDLHEAHLALEGVRPVFQNIFKRNGFSMLAVTLVDFHDAMELMLEAGNAKDLDRLQVLYPQVDAKMKAVEAEAADADIQTIRKQLDALQKSAQDGQTEALPKLTDQLKSSFVRVYLQRG